MTSCPSAAMRRASSVTTTSTPPSREPYRLWPIIAMHNGLLPLERQHAADRLDNDFEVGPKAAFPDVGQVEVNPLVESD